MRNPIAPDAPLGRSHRSARRGALLACCFTGALSALPIPAAAEGQPKVSRPAPATLREARLDGSGDTPEAATPADATLTLGVLVVGERRAGGEPVSAPVHEGTVLHTGDGLKVVAEVNRDAFVYILSRDATGKAQVVFPHARIDAQSRVAAGRSLEVPAPDKWWELDEVTGTEEVFILASLEPLVDVQEIAERISGVAPGGADQAVAEIATRAAVVRKKSKGDKKPMAVAGVVRGLTRVQPGASKELRLSNGRATALDLESLSGPGLVIRAVAFQHQ